MSTLQQATAQPSATAATDAGIWARIDKSDLARTLFLALCTVAVALGATWPNPRFPLIAGIGIVVGCWPIVAEAIHELRNRTMSMELSMLIAIVAAAIIGEWTTSLVITTFVLAAEILEDLSMDKSRDALSDLMAFLPRTVQAHRGAETHEIPLDQVKPGDILVIAPGGRIPVDGVITSGRSTVDASRITGESLPVAVATGDSVYSGSINQTGSLEMRADKIAEDSSYGKIIATVREAQASHAPAQRLADRLAAYLVYLALGGALITYLVTRDITATISVVVVAGACGIAAGTPLAILAAIAWSARYGAFVKSGSHLEELSTIDTVVFDKTGTLTIGEPTVVSIDPHDGVTQEALLKAAASAELGSEHPLGKAIVRYANDQGLTIARPVDFDYALGMGISATVEGQRVKIGNHLLMDGVECLTQIPGEVTPVYISIDDRFAGTILLADALRDSASEALAQLNQNGYHLVMLTGDQPSAAQKIASQLGIDEVHAGLLPDEKLARINESKAAGHRIAMIGDGVNDAPALAQAQVGISMGSGTDIARESADVVLISSDLGDLVDTLGVARRARSIVMFNFIGTIVVDLIGMVLAAMGILGPVAAAFVHVGSETAFILNSARLIPGPHTGAHRHQQASKTASVDAARS